MKTIFFFLLSLFSLHVCLGQKAVVANLKENVAYVDITNPLGVLVQGYNCGEFEVSTNNGTIEKHDNNCHYNFIPKTKGRAMIYIRLKRNRKYLDSFEFRTQLIPDPIVEIESPYYEYNKHKGDGKFHRKNPPYGISYFLKKFDYDVRFIGQNYSVSIIREGKMIFERKNIKGYLFESIKDGLSLIKDGDKIKFYGLIARGPENTDRKLPSIELIVAE